MLFLMTNVTLLRSLFLSSPSPVPAFLLFLLNVTKPEHEWEEFTRNAASPCGAELRKSVVVISSCGVFVDDHRCPESTSLRSRQHGAARQTAGSVWANVVVCPAHGHAQVRRAQGTFPASTVCQGGF